ncbi:MAG: CooT family nickel-binding protein [Desulfobacterales bacterium]|jgi:predicted RNA-binding protein|nr:CooT family nickel-binding protein [Desulfobacterales bacterium]
MCEANAYLITGEEPELFMEAVDVIEPEKDGLKLVSIFGEQKFIRGQIHSLSLIDHKIYLQETSDD